MLTTVTSHVRGLPPCHGINVSPSGRLPSILTRPTGSLVTGNACCGYSTGNDVVDGLMPGYFTRGLLTHRAVNPLCVIIIIIIAVIIIIIIIFSPPAQSRRQL